MADKFLMADYGGCIFHDGEVWTKDGTSVVNDPNASMDGPGGDVGNIAAFTGLSRADAQGRVSYTAEEMGCQYKYPTPSVNVSDSTTTTVVASVPVDGVLRVWCGDGFTNRAWYVNGIELISFGEGGSINSWQWSLGLNVRAGDHIEVYHTGGTGVEFYQQLIPFQYTNPG